MNFLLAILPILLIIFLMIKQRWSATRAGIAGYITALVIAAIFFGAGGELLIQAHERAALLAVDVLLIIWSAFLFYRVCDEAGAIRTIGQLMPQLIPDRGMQLLVIGWVFASFLQGVGGFGVPVAIVAPILAGLGFSPITAVVAPSLGHGWAVTFGSLGSSFQALINASGIPAEQLASTTALFLGAICLATGPILLHSAGGWPAVWRLAIPCLVIGMGMSATQYVIATAGPWNIAAFSAAMAGLLISLPIAFWFQREKNYTTKIDLKRLMTAFSGYILVILIILSAQFVPFIKQALNQVIIQVPFPEITTSLGFTTPAMQSRPISVYGHTGALLIYASILSYFIFRSTKQYRPGAAQRIIDGTIRRVLSPSFSILAMVSMAVIMEQAGMTDVIARGMAGVLGTLFPLVSPWIGALGAFMTGSNTNSNVVFGALQRQTAEILGFSLAVILAAQTVGGSLGSLAAPAKIVVGASTTRLAGREGEILGRLAGYVLFMIALLSLLSVIGILLTQ